MCLGSELKRLRAVTEKALSPQVLCLVQWGRERRLDRHVVFSGVGVSEQAGSGVLYLLRFAEDFG